MVALGSSHGAYGFNPTYFSTIAFNLCSASQDLYYSYHLYKYCQRELPQLKTVILFYSVFSPGFDLQKTKECERCVYFKEFFDIDYQHPDEQNLNKYQGKAKKYVGKLCCVENSFGYAKPTGFFDKILSVEERANCHLRENKRQNNQMQFLTKLIKECRDENIQFIVVIPPARQDYRDNLPAEKELFSKLLDLDITVFNFFADSAFKWKDFGDFDHLNIVGAEKLSKKLSDYLLRNEQVTK